MKYAKKSLGQNYLIDKNIIKKIISLTEIKNKNIIEIGPGQGALTEEILKKNPKSLLVIEKDFDLTHKLQLKYKAYKNLTIINGDILKYNLENKITKNVTVFGNLPYNISSQILVKFLKFKKWPPKIDSFIFMFQKELGEKIIANFLSKNYGRISILTNYRMNIISKFLVSENCFLPKPKVKSLVIQFKPKLVKISNLKKISNLEKITNIIFSNKRKMINKNIGKLLNKNKINQIKNLDLSSRPSEIKPEIYYKIAELFEKT
jgi:16S rRNA (adenine1518-N6/adenine1519-N6)-dimethyltransferase